MTAPGTALRRIGANSLIGSAWTLVSRVTGLGRSVVVAAVLGPTLFGDLYLQSNELPNMIFELLTGTLFVSLIVPALVRHLDRDGSAAAARLAGGFLTVSLLATTAVAAIVVAAGPFVLDLLSAGVPQGVERADPSAAWLLLGLLMLQVPLYAVAGVGAAAQNAQGRFAVAAAAPSVENVGIMLVFGLYAAVFGVGDVAGQGMAGVALLGGGTTAAVGLHAAVQWFGARRHGLTLRLTRGWRQPEVRDLVRMAVPSMGNAAVNVARYFGLIVVAAVVPGGVVAFALAFAFYSLPVALGAKPVSQAALPELSRAYHRGEEGLYGRTFDQSLGLVLFLTVPAAAGFALLHEPIATLVTFGQMATPEARSLVSLVLLGISAGIVGYAAMNFGTQAAYARRDARRPFVVVVARALLTAAGLGAAVVLLDGADVLLAIGVVVAVSDVIAGTWLCLRVRGGLPYRAILRTGAATAGMALVVWPIGAALGGVDDRGTAFLGLLVAGVAGGAVYLLVQRRLRSPELEALFALLSRRTHA
jgi:putative peptidoglycan lipid II flippase